MLAVILACVFAVLVAAVVLGFCGYELHWKLTRLRRDADRLQQTVAELGALSGALAQVQQRLAEVRTSVGRRS